MYCVSNGKVCLHVWHIKSKKWVYVPLAKWERMSARQRKKYDLSI